MLGVLTGMDRTAAQASQGHPVHGQVQHRAHPSSHTPSLSASAFLLVSVLIGREFLVSLMKTRKTIPSINYPGWDCCRGIAVEFISLGRSGMIALSKILFPGQCVLNPRPHMYHKDGTYTYISN